MVRCGDAPMNSCLLLLSMRRTGSSRPELLCKGDEARVDLPRCLVLRAVARAGVRVRVRVRLRVRLGVRLGVGGGLGLRFRV